MSLQHFVNNLRTSSVRTDFLEGRECWVMPVVMLTEGVHEGSKGPLFYPRDEMERSAPVWNTKPIVVYHPMINGEGVSACSAAILNSRKVGVLLETQAANGRLKAEAWVEKILARNVDSRIEESILANRVMEVSTGLWTEDEEKEGDYNGEKYGKIARNFKPDHLALLPDQIGACSVAKGAGLLVNRSLTLNSTEQGKLKAAWNKALADAGLTENGPLSQSNLAAALQRIMSDRTDPTGMKWSGWIEDVYDDRFVYWNNGKFYVLDYKEEDTAVTVSGEPKEVMKITTYKPVADFLVGNSQGDATSGEFDMSRAATITKLITNGKNWQESDREFLTKLTDDQFKKMTANEAAVLDPPPEVKDEKKKDEKKDGEKPAEVVAQTPAPTTDADILKNASPEMRAMLEEGLALRNSEKGRLADIITANAGNKFTKEFLVAKPLAELQGLAAIASAASPQAPASQSTPSAPAMFIGASGVVTNSAPVTETPLERKGMEFTR